MSFETRQLTNAEILEIFVNSDNESEYESQESDSDCSSTLWRLRTQNLRTPCPPMKTQFPLKILVVMEADRQWKKYWRSVVAGNQPAIPLLLVLLFILMSLRVQSPLPSPSEAECFKLFLTEELVGDIVEETNCYGLKLQEKREPGVRGKLAK